MQSWLHRPELQPVRQRLLQLGQHLRQVSVQRERGPGAVTQRLQAGERGVHRLPVPHHWLPLPGVRGRLRPRPRGHQLHQER